MDKPITEGTDEAVQRCLTGLSPRIKTLIASQENFKVTINATMENRRKRFRFKIEVIDTFELE